MLPGCRGRDESTAPPPVWEIAPSGNMRFVVPADKLFTRTVPSPPVSERLAKSLGDARAAEELLEYRRAGSHGSNALAVASEPVTLRVRR